MTKRTAATAAKDAQPEEAATTSASGAPVTVELQVQHTHTDQDAAPPPAQSDDVPLVQSAAPPTEYDATARQRIGAQIGTAGGTFPVTLIFDPQAGPHSTFDRTLKEYVRRLSAVPATDTADEEAEARALAQLDAAAWLFDTLMVDVEGIGAEEEAKPADWKTFFTPQEKNGVVMNAILFGVPLEDRAASGARVSWAALAVSATKLRVLFDGHNLDTRHGLKKGDTPTMREFGQQLEKMQRGESVMFELAALYDRLKVSAKPYKDGIVPVHHKAFALLGHLSTQLRVTRKN
jgi:hypothetical protein